jgi:hypothetical protein
MTSQNEDYFSVFISAVCISMLIIQIIVYVAKKFLLLKVKDVPLLLSLTPPDG